MPGMAFIVEFQRRGRHVIASAPQFDLRLAELHGHFRLVEALQRP